MYQAHNRLSKSLCPAGEDEGYLVTIVHDEAKGDAASELRVYDARTMSSDPLARVQLAHRVPYGFHCMHMSEEDFQQQAATL
jgi:carotenoid 9,10(9',10')-cleavage dioxygenase 1